MRTDGRTQPSHLGFLTRKFLGLAMKGGDKLRMAVEQAMAAPSVEILDPFSYSAADNRLRCEP
jgi:hypothetical protein